FGVGETEPHVSHGRLQRLSPSPKLPLHYPLEQPLLSGPSCRHDLDLAERTETGSNENPLVMIGDMPQQRIDDVSGSVELDLNRDRFHHNLLVGISVRCRVAPPGPPLLGGGLGADTQTAPSSSISTTRVP